MTTATEARAVAGWLLASDHGNVATEAAGMLADYAALLERQAMDVHSCHPNCLRSGCVNERLRAALQDADTIMGHDDAETEWRERWAGLWPNARSERAATA